MTGIFTCKENIAFDGSTERCPIFSIEMIDILIQCVILEFSPPASSVVGGIFTGVIPPYQFFQTVWMEKVLNMAVNNTLLRWLMREGNMNLIHLWYWLNVRYKSAAKLDTFRRLCRNKIWFLKLETSGLLVKYILCFQGLAILHQEIDKTI